MAIPRRLSRLPAATATTKRSTATLAVALGGSGARLSTAVLAAAAAAAGRTPECQSILLRMSRSRGASRQDIVSSLLASSPTPQSQVFDLLIRTYTQSRKPREAFRLLLDHRV